MTTPTTTRTPSGLRVMKFGGTSVAGAQGLRAVADLAQSALGETRLLLVASAMAGVTNLLTSGASPGADRSAVRSGYADVHRRALADLGSELEPAVRRRLETRLGELEGELGRILEGLDLLEDCSSRVLARLSCLGERASCALLAGLLEARGRACVELDPVAVLACQGDPLEAEPRPEEIRRRLAPFRDGTAPLALLPGFFGGDPGGAPVLLGRGGSDFSASLAAAALDADLLEIWTDVDGVFTADPRLVPEARLVEALSYEEAMELAHFGAKVLHPRTLGPLRTPGIPVRVCNTHRPDQPGTRVCAEAGAVRGPRGLSLLRGVALVDLSGPGLRGVPGLAARAFGALATRAINVILITQGSSECDLTVCVSSREAGPAVEALEEVFQPERGSGRMDPVVRRDGLAVLSLVGDGMLHATGLAGTFFQALGESRCNVVAIAQGSSERSISAVLSDAEAVRGLVSAHRHFFGPPEPLGVYLAGVGLVGRQLLDQWAKLHLRHPETAGRLRLCGLASSRRVLCDPDGLEPSTALARLEAEGRAATGDQPFGEPGGARGVLVDCTSSQALADGYPGFVDAGFHLVAASKKANSGSMRAWKALRERLAERRRSFLYETNVGAGLPFLGPLRDLRHGGDRVMRLEGILSGSLSFIFGQLDEGVPFSVAVRRAREAGFTEPDPREDLSGLDVARKALILHREMGGELELHQVEAEGVLSAAELDLGSPEAFLEELSRWDETFRRRVEAGTGVLRFVARITPHSCRVGPAFVSAEDPLAQVKAGENALAFYTEAYDPHPMVVRGYGAGAAVTAAGVLADILRIAASPGA